MQLSQKDLAEACRLRIQGAKWREIAAHFGVTISVAHHAVRDELRRREWARDKATYESERTDMPDAYRAEFLQKLAELDAA